MSKAKTFSILDTLTKIEGWMARTSEVRDAGLDFADDLVAIRAAINDVRRLNWLERNTEFKYYIFDGRTNEFLAENNADGSVLRYAVDRSMEKYPDALLAHEANEKKETLN